MNSNFDINNLSNAFFELRKSFEVEIKSNSVYILKAYNDYIFNLNCDELKEILLYFQ